MKFSEFKQYRPKEASNIYVFVCEDDFLLQEFRPVGQRIFGGDWVFEKYSMKEFEEIPAGRLMDEALTPSLFSQNRVLIVTNGEQVTKGRISALTSLQSIPQSSLRIVLAVSSKKSGAGWVFPVIEVDSPKPAEAARWLVDRYKLAPEVARHLVENVGADLYQLYNEMEKLQTYVGTARAIDIRDVDVLVLRSEQFGPFELDDALLAKDYKRCVQIISSMLDDG